MARGRTSQPLTLVKKLKKAGVDGRDIAHYRIQIRRKLEDHDENDIEDHYEQSILIAGTGSSSCPTNITLTPADTTLTQSP